MQRNVSKLWVAAVLAGLLAAGAAAQADSEGWQ